MRWRDAAIGAGLVVVAAGCGVGWYVVQHRGELPPGLARANGRLELARIDVAVKYPGRVTELDFNEGDLVAADQVLAREDDISARASLDAARAHLRAAQADVARAQAERDARQATLHLARHDMDHAQTMFRQHLVSDMELTQHQTSLDTATAAAEAAGRAVEGAQAVADAAQAQVAQARSAEDDMTIRAPVAGRIEYRIVEKGAVLPGGGRVASLLNPADMYLTVFYPAQQAGQLHVGDQARIALDALHQQVIPATISFVSPEAQFTPKYVETATERDKLVYRVKLRVSPETAGRYGSVLKAGMTGDGYVRTDPAARWPASLDVADAPQ
ncbi:HlyD family efflux transporter periplasmic adaptor subunit [Komagataeibacter sp. AV436]|uniref:HlyD family efflux transporter periplasmic adaptor subunit n=1 Tax=Komagataeibacter melomenusus TaxID=2766578 RepID=A0ABX2AB00_9PROT|nr:HlyD family efflux transporter periplasmic adaptor subunit [Komagataeibacter melomenusus]MBV1830176.1 HlyD family efflux transporter periplasmic adaptor subunit [Komagataeibacter melomenusus]NPC65517.1 HlyD family efflux transporter periplasmic adaptor subunit [Komagataeibacter melomenusus]